MKSRRRRSASGPPAPAPDEAAAGPRREWPRAASESGLEPERGRPDRPLRRLLAVVLALSELGLLGFATSGPWFAVRSVSVSGLHHLDRAAVVSTAGLQQPHSLLTLDGDTIRRKLARLPWVRSSSAQPLLPNRVQITIEEWKPVALYQAGSGGGPLYLNELGVVLGAGRPDPSLVSIAGPAAGTLKPGDRPLDPQLLHALVEIQAGLPAIFGQTVAGFQLDCLGNLALTTNRGVRLIFGRVLTPEEFAALNDKLSALKSITADPAVSAPNVEYINLENPLAPAVKVKGATPPPSPSPSPGGGPRPTPTPTPGGITLTCR